MSKPNLHSMNLWQKEDPEYLAGFDKAVLDAYGLYEGKYYGYPIMLTTTILFIEAIFNIRKESS